MSVVNKIPDVVKELYALFNDRGWELAIVGGWVRDAILGDESPDIDLATNATPPVIKEIISGWADDVWTVGEAFGTIALRKDTTLMEITTYRADTYDGASRKPSVIFGTNLLDDLKRRDFTINAMAIMLPDSFIDPHCGSEDMRQSILATPGPAEVSISDDPLRILRACRFASKYDLSPSADLMNAMTKYANRLFIVSAERQSVELQKLIMLPRPNWGLGLLGLINARRPMRLMDLERLLKLYPEADFPMRMAALLNNEEPDVVKNYMKSMRFSNYKTRKTATLVELSQAAMCLTSIPRIRAFVVTAKDFLEHALNLTSAVRGSQFDVTRLAIERIAETEDLSDTLTGFEIMQLFDLKYGGLEVGEAINEMRRIILHSGPTTKEKMSEELIKWRTIK